MNQYNRHQLRTSERLKHPLSILGFGLLVAGLVGCAAPVQGADEVGATSDVLTASKWGGWGPIPGGVGSSAPAVAGGGGSLNVYIRGTDNAVWNNYWSSLTGWLGWSTLGAIVTSKPAVANYGTSRYAIAAKGLDNQIWVRTAVRSTETPSHWQPVPGSMSNDAPALVFNASTNKLFLFIRSGQTISFATNTLWSGTYSHANWSAFTAIPNGLLTSAPAAIGSLGLVVVARGTNNAFWWTESLTGSSWSAWAQIPGQTYSTYPDPTVVHWGTSSSIHVLGTDDSGTMRGNSRTGSSTTGYAWSGYASVAGGTFTSAPGAWSLGTGGISLVGRGTGTDYWVNTYQE